MWWLLSENDGAIWSGGPYEEPNQERIVGSGCLSRDALYTLLVWDGHGDGICCQHGDGSYAVWVEGIPWIVSDGVFGLSDRTVLDLSAWSAPPSPPPSSSCPTGTSRTELTVLTDFFGSETSWWIESLTLGGAVIRRGGGYGSWEEHVETMCLSNTECYKLTVLDEWGDGLCCSYGYGSYSVVRYGTDQYNYTSSFPDGHSEEHVFGRGCSGTTPVILYGTAAASSTTDTASARLPPHRVRRSRPKQRDPQDLLEYERAKKQVNSN